MMRSPKKYNTIYKKTDIETDPYRPRRSPAGILQCRGCGAFYYRRRWTLTLPAGAAGRVEPHPANCPACTRVRDRFPGADLQLRGVRTEERGDIFRVLRNEEKRAREKNPLERIMRIEQANGNWKIETTTEKLAQRLGRSVKKARGGNVD